MRVETAKSTEIEDETPRVHGTSKLVRTSFAKEPTISALKACSGVAVGPTNAKFEIADESTTLT